MEIRNIPPSTTESTDELVTIAMKLGSILIVPIKLPEIKNIFRVSKKDGSKPIILELTTDLLKNKIIDSYKKYSKNKGPDNPNTRDLGLGGQASKIYVSECLTPKTKNLFFLARNYAKSNNWNYCWTAHGNVFLRKQQGDPALRIKTESDLKDLAITSK